MQRIRRFIPLAALLATACDLSTTPDRSPSELWLGAEVITATAGERVPIEFRVLDGRGQAITSIPGWSVLEWSAMDEGVVASDGPLLNAVAPGQTRVTARLAGLERSVVVRVNPRELKLEIARVALNQPGSPGAHLQPGNEARLQVYLVGDAVNFFEPGVRASLMQGGRVLHTVDLTRGGPSVPLVVDVEDAAAPWTGVIAGELIQPGVSLVIEADPTGVVPHAAGSRLRHPEAGSFSLAVGASAVMVRGEGVYLTQSVQRYDGSVPLVEGRDALLRVFLSADEENQYRPQLRARFYRNGAVVHQVQMTSASMAIPREIDEASLSGSWNVLVPGDVLRPGVSLVVEVDPEGAVPIKIGSTSRIPASGTLPLDVRAVPRLNVRMVPIIQASMGTVGNISSANLSRYMGAATAMFPIGESHADLRTPYQTNATAGTYDGWMQILREVEALRRTDGSGRYYYGVLRHPGGNQIAGIGYIGYPVAVGYDHPSDGPETFAHELGHNFNLSHAPCGGPAQSDPAFPYADGGIGAFGYDVATGTLKLPWATKDLMTYCNPTWISDYSYLKALNFRHQRDWALASASTQRVEDAVLVWGGVSDGRIVLEPSFELPMVPSLPSGTGRYQIQGLDAAGAVVFSYRFEPREVDHIGGGNFSFAIPSRIAQPDRLAQVVVSGPPGRTSRTRPLAPPPGSRAATARRPDGVELSWRTSDYAMAMIRDAQTGEVLSFARNGRARVPGRVLDVLLSDGVRSTRERIDAR